MNEVSVKEQNEKGKIDFHPIWIYVVSQMVLPTCIMYIITLVTSMTQEESAYLAIIISMFALAITFFIMYFKKIKTDIKRLTKKQIIFTVIAAIVGLALNFGVSMLFSKLNVKMENQDLLSNMFGNYKIPLIILATIPMPFAEEIVFRYSFGSLIRKKTVFVIVSSLLFAIGHGIGIATTLYFLLGVVYCITYLKTDRNVVASSIAHAFNNIVGVIFMLIG